MLAVVDPYLLYFDEEKGLKPVAADTLADMVRMLDESGASIPEDEFYWPKIWSELGAPLLGRMRDNRDYKRHLDALRRRARHTRIPAPPAEIRLESSAFQLMFGGLGAGWVQTMQGILAGCVGLDETILLTRLIPGRNARPSDHEDYRHVFVEKTCWEFVIQPGGAEPRRVACVCSSRNMEVPWTCRYADGLPSEEDGGKCPFYPPEDWREESRRAVEHKKSRPCWQDDQDLFWAEPQAQSLSRSAYHWDVYLEWNPNIMQRNLGKKIKGKKIKGKNKKDEAPYMNVCRWRSGWEKDGEGRPGDIHHPDEMKDKPGWRR